MKKVNETKWQSFKCYKPGIGFPLVILLIGLYWLGRDLGWIETRISLWPIILIAIGLYWTLARLFCRKS